MRFVFIFFLLIGALSCFEKNKHQSITIKGDGITGNADNFVEKMPQFFRTEINGTSIEFFIIKIDGKVGVYLDRCKRCFNSGLGFSFEKERFRCKACNQSLPIEKIPGGVGTCYPIPVDISINGNKYSVSPSNLYRAYYNKSKI